MYKSNKIGSKKMDRFSATVSIEEQRQRTLTQQKVHASGYMYIFLGWKLETKNKKLKGWSLAGKVFKWEIISITGHSTEAGLDPYDSRHEKQ